MTKKYKSKISLKSVSILVVVSMLFTLLMVETVIYFVPSLLPPVIRLVFQQDDVEYYPATIPDPELGFTYAPDLVDYAIPFEDTSYKISTVSLGYDNIGFRDDELDSEPFAIVIGDSFTSCVGVDLNSCWVEQLEMETGRDFANLGVLGYSPQQEHRMLSKYGLPLKPKLVLWVFFANDVIEAWRFNQFGEGATDEGEFWENPVRSWLAENSAIYMTGSYFWYNRYFFSNLTLTKNQDTAQDVTLAWWLANADLTIPEISDGLSLTQTEILQAYQKTQTKDGDIQFVVIVIPYREQIKYADSSYQSLLDGPNNAIVDFCRRESISVIDLTPLLREFSANHKEPIYFSDDSHMNEKGNEIIGTLLAQELDPFLKDGQAE